MATKPPFSVPEKSAQSSGFVVVRASDRGEANYLPPAYTRESDGALKVYGRVAVPGIYEYPEFPPNMRRVLVTGDLLRKSQYSLPGVAVTLEHPEVDGVRVEVTPENYKDFVVGEVRDSVFVDDIGDLYANLIIRDAKAIEAILTGVDGEAPIRGLSPSYSMDLALTPGVHPLFGAYDAICTNRSDYNHVALTASPRAGDAARLIMQTGDSATPTPSGSTMNLHTLRTLFDTLKAKASDSVELGDLLKALEIEMDSLSKQMDAVKGEKAGLGAKIKALQDQMEALRDTAQSRDAALAEAADLKAKLADAEKMVADLKAKEAESRDAAQDSIPLSALPAILEERIALREEAQRRGLDASAISTLSNDSILTAIVVKTAQDSGVPVPEKPTPEWVRGFYAASLATPAQTRKAYGADTAAPTAGEITPAPLTAPVSSATPAAPAPTGEITPAPL